MVNEGIALNAGLDSKASIYDNTSTEQQNGSSSSEHVVDVERVRVDKVVSDVKNAGVRPSYDNNTLNEQEINIRESITTCNHEGAVLRKVQERLSKEFEPFARYINLQLNSFEKSLVKEMIDDLTYVMSLEDEFYEKCLILDIQTEFFKTQFESAIPESHSHVYGNEMFE
ncbi:hypothetical protein Tco_1455142 [Tanacetum coccineum]